ncbi:class I SAM-dependent methyltransferase [bacterium]|nr:class I SAM-dependent methyltransferase [bacterium]
MTEKAGPESFEQLYYQQLQGEFYADAYYRERSVEEESAIVYSDDEDKRLFSYMINTFFRCKRVLEIGCAMGYLLRQLVAYGYDAYGLDFSQYCIERVPAEIKGRVRQADLLAIPFQNASFDLVIGLDILEHLPPSLLQKALLSIKRVLKPGGLYLGVIPAYGENEFGPMVFDYHQRESWIEDVRLGRPFREIPLDVDGKPHMGHLIHATVGWWQHQFERAGFERLGQVELALHQVYDTYLDRGRWGIFIFQRKKTSLREKFLPGLTPLDPDFISHFPLRPQGLYSWEYWDSPGWTRWTEMVACEIIKRQGRSLIVPFLVAHPDCSESNPVIVHFILNDQPLISFQVPDRGWRIARFKWSSKEKIGVLRLNVSRTWQPDRFDHSGDKRQLGIALQPFIQGKLY